MAPPAADELGNLGDMDNVFAVEFGHGLDHERRPDDLYRSGRGRPDCDRHDAREAGSVRRVGVVTSGPVLVTW